LLAVAQASSKTPFLNKVAYLTTAVLFFLISQNVAICPKTFSNIIDRQCRRHAGDTSSDISSIREQSKVTVYDHWGFHTALVRI